MILFTRKTDKGRKRKINEDYCYVPDEKSTKRLFVVADGIGGYQGGEVASKLAVDVFSAIINNADIKDDNKADEALYEAIEAANTAIIDYAKENEFYAGMGTTLVAALCVADKVKIINIGDSRAYKFDGDKLEQITVDHSLVQQLIDSKKITKKQGRNHPRRNIITRALGDDVPYADIFNVRFDEGDIILLCSDGVSDMLDDDSICEVLKSKKHIKAMAQALIDAANERGGYDNISCVIIQNTGEDKH